MKKIILILILLTILIGCTQKTPTSYLYRDEFEITPIITGDSVSYKTKIYTERNQRVPLYIYTRYDPQTLEDIPIDINKTLNYSQMYITIDPYENLTSKTTIAALEIDKFIDNKYLFNIPVNSAFTEPLENNTVKTCNDVKTGEIGIINLKLGSITQITSENGCIIVQATTEDNLIRAADRLSLTLIGLMV